MKCLQTSASLLAMALLTPGAVHAAMIEMTDVELGAVQAEMRQRWPVFRAHVDEYLADFSPTQRNTPPDDAGMGRTVFDRSQAKPSSPSGDAADATDAQGWPFHPLASRALPLRKVAALPTSIGMALFDAELRLLYVDGQLIDLR